jgi:hypothetical protein
MPREQFKVQPKPRDVQNALWRIIHDSDYRPRGVDRMTQKAFREPWTPTSGQSGWDLGANDSATPAARVFKFDNASGAAQLYFADEVNVPARHSAFNDWLTYDSEAGRGPGPWNLVGDLKLQFYYDRKSGDGPLQLRLSKRGRTFVAEIGKTTARLLVEDEGGQQRELFAAKPIATHAGAPMLIEFSNADYQVRLRIDDVEIFRTTPEQYSPNLPDLLSTNNPKNANNVPQPRVSITAERQQATLSHVSLWRDI